MAEGDGLPSFSLPSSGPASLSGEPISLGDNEPDFVHDADRQKFTCPVCRGPLQDIRQTSCGHHLCAKCVKTYLGGTLSKPCPVGESDCQDITADNVYPDRSFQKEMNNSLVYCTNRKEGCSIQLKLKDLKKHTENNCPETSLSCPFGCGKILKRKEIPAHKASCPAQPMDCPYKIFGCTFVGKKEDLEKHKRENLQYHLDLIADHASNVNRSNTDAQAKLREMVETSERLERSAAASVTTERETQDKVKHLEAQFKETRLKMVGFVEKLIIVERRVGEVGALQTQLEGLTASTTALTARVQRLEETGTSDQRQGSSVGPTASSSGAVGRWANLESMAGDVSGRFESYDRQIGIHDVRLAEMDLRFQLLETASYEGTLVWKIRDYDRRKRDAVNGRTLSLYSQPFYSSRFGYKMCARVYLNGDGMGKTTHMSLFFVVMRGEYDALLTWPFRQKVTLTLLDQAVEKRHLTDHFQPDPTSSSFQRPTSEMNVASGCPLFVSHSVLENPANGYLRQDTIFIRIVVDKDPNPQNF